MSNDDWKKLDEFRQSKIVANGKVVVIKPLDMNELVPMFCPVCKFPIKTFHDSIAFKEFECCSTCELTFARPNLTKWTSELKWRPDKTTKEWQEYYATKLINSKPVINIH